MENTLSKVRLMVVGQENKLEFSVLAEIINRALKPHRKMLKTVVGKTRTALSRNIILDSTMDNFLLESVLDLTGADVAFSNGWRYGAQCLSDL